MALPPISYQKIKNSLSKFHKQSVSYILSKTYDNMNSCNEVLTKNFGAFIKSSIQCLNQRWTLSSQLMFVVQNFQTQATFDTIVSHKL